MATMDKVIIDLSQGEDYAKLLNYVKQDSRLVHGKNMSSKIKKIINAQNSSSSKIISQAKALSILLSAYISYIKFQTDTVGYSDAIIRTRVKSLNNYFLYFTSNASISGVFKNTDKLRSTILEEFMYLLFRDYVKSFADQYAEAKKYLKSGNPKAYTNLFFHAQNIEQFIRDPQASINQKDLDYAIYREIPLVVNNTPIKGNLKVPVIAIENKTFLDKTMLDGAIAAAEKLKAGNPYSRFYVVTECYEVGAKVDPSYSQIDQIYVLRKSIERNYTRPIDENVVISLFKDAQTSIIRPWFDIKTKLNDDGKIL